MKKFLKYIVFALVIAMMLEGIILFFTDNEMYGVPDDSISTKTIEGIDNVEWNDKGKMRHYLEFELLPQDYQVKTLCLYFRIGSYVDSIICYKDLETEPFFIQNNTDSSTIALLNIPESDKKYRIIIQGNFELLDSKISSRVPLVKKQRIPNPLRCIFLFALILIIFLYKDEFKKIFLKIRKINYRILLRNVFYFVGITIGWIILSLLIIYRLDIYSHYQLRFTILLGISVAIIVFYAAGKIKKIENFWLLLSMIFVLCCVVIWPVFSYGGDSAVHFQRSLDVAQVYDENTFGTYVEALADNEHISNAIIEKYIEIANISPVHSCYSFKYKIFKNIRYIAYIPYAIGLVMADAFNLNAYLAFMISELTNGWFCCILYYLAARRLKSGKLIVLLFGWLPYILILMSRYSYTSFVIAAITYASAQIIGLLQDRKEIKVKKMIPIYGTFLIGTLPKAPYMLTSLLTLLLPKKRFSTKDYKKHLLLLLSTNAILLASLIIPIFTNDKGIGIYSDTRGGENVDAIKQLLFILKNPVSYARILIKNILQLFSPNSFVFGVNGFTSLGSTIGKGHWVIFPSFILLIFLLVILTDKKMINEIALSWKNRLYCFILTLVNICLICTIMYMNYSVVGAQIINGINPLYLLTFMFPFFYFCRLRNINIKISYRKYNVACLGSWILIMFWTVYSEVVMAYL